MTLKDDIKTEHADKTAAELKVWCDANLTGSIGEQKARFRAIKEKDAEEKQVVADSFLNLKDNPKSEAVSGSDLFGNFIKIYPQGKNKFDDDGGIING